MSTCSGVVQCTMKVQSEQLLLQIMGHINFVYSICIYFKYCDLPAPLSAFNFLSLPWWMLAIFHFCIGFGCGRSQAYLSAIVPLVLNSITSDMGYRGFV